MYILLRAGISILQFRAIDMMTLINALVHYDEAEYLYALTESNFFSLAIPKRKCLNLGIRFQEE